MTTNLYDIDYPQWIEKQAIALRERKPDLLDWENLLEEVESLGKEQINAVNSLLKQIIIHRLKLDYLNDRRNQNHWESEINEFVDQVEDRLSSSIKNKIDLPKIYGRARRDVLKQYFLNIPEASPYSLDELLKTFP